MDEYIKREEAIHAALSIIESSLSFLRDAAPASMKQEIGSIPAADVQPVKWIPVTERMPEETGNYLVVFDCGHGSEVHEAYYFKCFDSGEWYDPVEEYQKYNPTHWMPLPKPPEECET